MDNVLGMFKSLNIDITDMDIEEAAKATIKEKKKRFYQNRYSRGIS